MLKVLELFGGIGACSKALEKLGINYEIADYVEIDKYAVKSFNAIHNTNFEPQDITQWDKDIEVDLVMHGSPCQDFSLAGLQAGGDEGSGTRSSLMYETIRIVKKLKPKYVVWENVKNLLSKKHRHNFDSYLEIMESLGYKNYYQVLNAKDYGIPQNRERVFTISIRNDIDKEFIFPPKQELKLKLKDMLEDNVDEKYYLSDKLLKCFMSNGTGKYPRRERFLQNINKENKDVANTIITTEGNKPTCNFIKDERNLKEKLCDKLIEENKVKEYDVVNHSYSNSRNESLENNKDIIIANNESPTLTTRADTLGVAIKDKKINKSLQETLEKNEIPDGINMIDSYNRNVRNDEISGTITTRVDASNNTYLAIKNATKKGYLEATDGDGIDLTQPNSKTRRGRVQKDSIQTLTTQNNLGVCVIGNYMPSGHEASRVVDNEGIAPTIKENHGTITATNEPRVIGGIGEKKSNGGTQWYQQDRVYDNNISPTLTSTANPYYPDKQLRIRKLTPCECWKLMGFDKSDFDKASQVNSNAQLYKQAGNSIVVNVLENILKNLL